MTGVVYDGMHYLPSSFILAAQLAYFTTGPKDTHYFIDIYISFSSFSGENSFPNFLSLFILILILL